MRNKSMIKYIQLFLFMVFACAYTVEAQILIFTYAYNRPDFIELQYKTFKKFLKDDYMFVVFNDARDYSMIHAIEAMCMQCGIGCIPIPQQIHDQPYLTRLPAEKFHDPSVRTANVIQYSLNTLGFNHDDIVCIIDSDMFLIKEFSIKNYMENADIAGHKQLRGNGKISYVWNGIVFLNMPQLPNKNMLDFNCGQIDGYAVDTGGYTHHYLKNNPAVKIRYIEGPRYISDFRFNNYAHTTELLKGMHFSPALIEFIQTAPSNIEFFLDYTFVHYRSGSNWDKKSFEYHEKKTRILNTFINTILACTKIP
jgi:hypothetical protein